MNPARQSGRACRALLLPAMLISLAAGQEREDAAALIRTLTNRTGRAADEARRIGLLGCGQVNELREAARRLAGLGVDAVEAIERALAEAGGGDAASGYGSEWLRLALARIRGRDAFEYLRKSQDEISQGRRQRSLDEAIALALDVTSYVSSERAAERVIRCGRGAEPRDALDGAILAWLNGNRGGLEVSLSPEARAALTSLPDAPGGAAAIGYRFAVSGRWAEPAETLREEGERGDSGALAGQSEFGLRTVLVDRLGRVCGGLEVRCRQAPAGGYLVDNHDIGEVLRVIASCARR